MTKTNMTFEIYPHIAIKIQASSQESAEAIAEVQIKQFNQYLPKNLKCEDWEVEEV